jgi:hypothetical protein
VLEDPSGSLTLDQVQQPEVACRFAPVKGSDLNFGYSASTYWLRLNVSAEPVLLGLADRAGLPVPRFGGLLRRGGRYRRASTGGDLMPHGARPFPHRNLVFPLAVEPGGGKTVICG